MHHLRLKIFHFFPFFSLYSGPASSIFLTNVQSCASVMRNPRRGLIGGRVSKARLMRNELHAAPTLIVDDNGCTCSRLCCWAASQDHMKFTSSLLTSKPIQPTKYFKVEMIKNFFFFWQLCDMRHAEDPNPCSVLYFTMLFFKLFIWRDVGCLGARLKQTVNKSTEGCWGWKYQAKGLEEQRQGDLWRWSEMVLEKWMQRAGQDGGGWLAGAPAGVHGSRNVLENSLNTKLVVCEVQPCSFAAVFKGFHKHHCDGPFKHEESSNSLVLAVKSLVFFCRMV